MNRPVSLAILGLLLLLATLALGGAWSPVAADDGTSVVATIDQAAADEGVSPSLLRCLAFYESSDDPWAVSPTHDFGLMQFHFYANGWSLMDATPYAGMSPFDPVASSRAAAWLIKRGYLHRWTTWRLCA